MISGDEKINSAVVKATSVEELLNGCPANQTICDNLIRAWAIINNTKYKKIVCAISGGSDSDVMLDIVWRCDKDNKVDYLFKVLGVDTSNVPDAYSILLTKPIQRRRHKKKRINKKWLKKYGYKLLVDYKDGWRIKSYKDGVYEFVKEKNYDRT